MKAAGCFSTAGCSPLLSLFLFLMLAFPTEGAPSSPAQCLYVADLTLSYTQSSYGLTGAIFVFDANGTIVQNVTTLPTALALDNELCQCSLIGSNLDDPFVWGMDVNEDDGVIYFSYFAQLCWIGANSICQDYSTELNGHNLAQLTVDESLSRLFVLSSSDPIIYVFSIADLTAGELGPSYPELLHTWTPLGDFSGKFSGLTLGPEGDLYVGLGPAPANNDTVLIKLDPQSGSLIGRLTDTENLTYTFASTHSLTYNPILDLFFIIHTTASGTSIIRQFRVVDLGNETLAQYNVSTLVPEGTLNLAVDQAVGMCPYIGPSPSPTAAPPKASSVNVVAIALPVVLGSLLFVVIVLVIVGSLVYFKFFFKRRRYFDSGEIDATHAVGDLEMEAAVTYTYREVDWGDVKLGRLLGQGAFGKVYKGEYRGAQVAVKMFEAVKLEEMEDRLIKELRTEAEMMERLSNHPNIVKFVGAVTQGVNNASCFALVVEYCPRGSMFQLLVKKRRKLPLATLVQMARDAASGILHLHKEHVIHRDIEVYVSDFGLARVKETGMEAGTTKQDFGPIAWMAPEALNSRHYSEATDAYSFGVLLWEMMARKKPWAGMEAANIVNAVTSNMRPKIPRDCDPIFKQIIKQCWKHSPAQRPTFERIVATLTEYHRSLRDIQALDGSQEDESQSESEDDELDDPSNGYESQLPLLEQKQHEARKEVKDFIQQIVAERDEDFSMVEKATLSVLSELRSRYRLSKNVSKTRGSGGGGGGGRQEEINTNGGDDDPTGPAPGDLAVNAYVTIVPSDKQAIVAFNPDEHEDEDEDEGEDAEGEAGEGGLKKGRNVYAAVVPSGERKTKNTNTNPRRPSQDGKSEAAKRKGKGSEKKDRTPVTEKRRTPLSSSVDVYASTTPPVAGSPRGKKRQQQQQQQSKPTDTGDSDDVYITVSRNT